MDCIVADETNLLNISTTILYPKTFFNFFIFVPKPGGTKNVAIKKIENKCEKIDRKCLLIIKLQITI
jgi:hypothetical protein